MPADRIRIVPPIGDRPAILIINERLIDRDATVTTTAGALADLCTGWAEAVVRASDPTRRRKVVHRDATGRIVAVDDEAVI